MTVTESDKTVRAAVVAGPTTPGTAADWELFFARRALAKLKSRLGREGLLDLLQPDLELGAQQLSDWLGASGGKWRPAVTELEVTGLGAAEFFAYFASVRDNQPVMLAAQPEHFVIAHTDDGNEVVENLGPHIAHFFVHFTGEEEAIDELLPDHGVRLVGHARTEEGVVVGHVLHQFRETDGGFDARLGIYFPSAAPEDFIEAHRRHLAVEFTNWIMGAGASLGRSLASPAPIEH